METDKIAVIGIHGAKNILSHRSGENLTAYISHKININGRMLFTLGDYLTKYTKKFDRVRYIITDEVSGMFPNGTLTGIIGLVNRSKIDIGINPHVMNEESTDLVDFAFPYELDTSTFVTRKAEYKPQIFSILQIFSMPLWIAIISTLMAISLVHYVIFKRRHSFEKILLHVFAVLLRQSSVIKPSCTIKQLLVFSWVVGAMLLCLAYDSVILSFLSFPPVTQVKDVPQLAKAVKEGHYHCIADRYSSIPFMLLKSKDETLKIIGRDIRTNNLSTGSTLLDFFYDRNIQNLALIATSLDIDVFTVGRKFASHDRFLKSIYAMPVQKNFCCKKLIDKFVHRLMASGLYFKYRNDRAFLIRRLMKHEEKDTSKRVLTLTDVAPAFIFLIFGHIISLLVLIVEILSNRMKKKYKKSSECRNKEDSE